jgi:hypothetical protein
MGGIRQGALLFFGLLGKMLRVFLVSGAGKHRQPRVFGESGIAAG